MKHCPSCSAELISPDAAFCAECGASLRSKKSKVGKHEAVRNSPPKKKTKQKKEKVPSSPRVELPYDGYYDDVLPSDDGEYRQGLDPKTVRNIVYLLVGVIIIVAICIVMLYLL